MNLYKITIAFISVLILTNEAIGQKLRNKGLSIEASGTAGISSFFHEHTYILQSPEFRVYSSRPHFSGGLGVGYMFNDHMGVFTGVRLSAYQYASQGAPEYYNEHINYHIEGKTTYIEIPLNLRYVYSWNKIGIYANLGGMLGILQNAVTDYRFLNGAWPEFKESIAQGDPTHNLNHYCTESLLVFVNLGVRIPVNSFFYLHVGPEISFQGSNLFKDRADHFSSRGRVYLNYTYSGEKWQANYFTVSLQLTAGFKLTN